MAAAGDALDAEFEGVRSLLPRSRVDALRRDFVSVQCGRTEHNLCRVKLTIPEGYPQERLFVRVSSKVLPEKFARKHEKILQDGVNALEAGAPQIVAAIEPLHRFLCGNVFTACWRETRQLAALVTESGGQIGFDEQAGVITVRLRSGGFRTSFRLLVAADYPDVAVGIEDLRSNLPPPIWRSYRAQAEEAVRRCVAGFDMEAALRASNPLQGPGRQHEATDGPKVRLTNDHMQNMKHDVRFLKQATDLRQVERAKDRRNGQLQASTQERRSARRTLSRLNKKEAQSDADYERRMASLEAQESAAGAPGPSGDAQPQIGAVAHLLVRRMHVELPRELCQACGRRVLPEDASAGELNAQHPRRPVRVWCGHYFHWECLDAWMTSPPFVRTCTHCDRRIYHPDYNPDPKVAERAWANKQAREREINDVSDFLDLGDDFSAF